MDLSNEIEYRFSRSSGKGGQHVNKVETKVQLKFSIPNSLVLTNEQKQILMKGLQNRLTGDGEIVLTNQKTRSQRRNKNQVTAQLYELIRDVLRPIKKRKKSKIPESVKRKRLRDKKLRSLKKENRRRISSSD